MPTMEIPEKRNAVLKAVKIPCSTGKGEDKKTSEFDAELPPTLADAIGAFGEKEVFDRFLNAYVVFLQGKERNKLAGNDGKTRKRAPYLETLGAA